MVWATAYRLACALDSPGEAILYSVDSMSARGASRLVLEGYWRMIGALEATEGMLLFGISTAFIFTVMQSLLGAHDPAALSADLAFPRTDGVTADRLAFKQPHRRAGRAGLISRLIMSG